MSEHSQEGKSVSKDTNRKLTEKKGSGFKTTKKPKSTEYIYSQVLGRIHKISKN